jgi:hypothetical protein
MSNSTLENNIKAASMSKSQLRAAGLLDRDTAVQEISTRMSKKLYGFSRKQLPPGIPDEPRVWLFSISEYGETISLGAGFGETWTIEPCPDGEQHGPACAVKPLYFQEEVVVDKTEHTPYTDVQIVECLMRQGAGLNASLDRRRVGWFVSYSNPPKQEEIEEAQRIYSVECRRLFDEANQMARSGKPEDYKGINEEHRRAKKYLKQTADWDLPTQKMVTCPRCGDTVREGAMLHAACGHVFKLYEYWLSMVQSGQKVITDAPESIQERLVKQLKK